MKGVNNPPLIRDTGPALRLRRSPLVVIVDDDISVGRSTRRLLRSSGLRAEAFASAEEFMTSDLVDEAACLILDLRMPRMNGLELQSRLAEALKPISIIFLSAHSTAEEELQALKAGASQFLHKPVSQELLLAAIRDAMKTPHGGREKKS